MNCKKKYIPNNLRKFRRLMGYKQSDVVKKLELKSTSIISRWERGLAMPSGKYLLLLETMYKTLVAELYYEYKKELQAQHYPEEKHIIKSAIQKKPKRLDRGP